jgi:competence protein ComEC
VGLCLFAPLFLPASSPLDEHEFQVDFLDVGQGLAVVVRTAEHTLLYDTGFSNDTGFDVGQRVILPYLWHQGITVLNRVVLSHDDRDHVGGYASVSSEIPVRQLTVMPGSKYLADSSVAVCQAGEGWSWGGVDFQFLHPQVNAGGQENNRSCVLKISGRGGSVLLTGDIEKSAEKNLILHAHNQLQADILLAPHHGSKTSSTRDFIASVKAKEVVYSAGYRNRFGFPRPEVMARYTRTSARQWNTADSGMLRYRFDGMKDRYQRWVYRHENRRFWQSGAVE